MQSNTSESTAATTDGGGTAIGLALPVRSEDLFKHRASRYVLNFLSDNPELDASIRQLSRVTPVSERATSTAVDALAAADLVETFHEGNARRVRINRSRLRDPADPFEQIPQVPYRTAVRVGYHYLRDELAAVRGVVLFGSVARGTADRQSDIDLWVLVDGSTADLYEQRNRANELARQLEELQIPPSIALKEEQNAEFEQRWPAIRQELEADNQNWASADRHTFEFVVETPQSIIEKQTRVRPDQLFGEGITLYETETLRRVKQEILRNE